MPTLPAEFLPPFSAEAVARASPMFAQYLSIRKRFPEYMLFYRMGDFYELFFADAQVAAKALDITLTQRGQLEGKPVPMAGVPVHAHHSYLARLIKQGYRVAICEQLDSKAPAGKSLVHRDVVRLVTPGTLTEEALLNSQRADYLAAVAYRKTRGEQKPCMCLGLAYADISTGMFFTEALSPCRMALFPDFIAETIARIEPKELLLPQSLVEMPELYALWQKHRRILTPLPDVRFSETSARQTLLRAYGNESLTTLGLDDPVMICAAGQLYDYVDLTQVTQRPRLTAPRKRPGSRFVAIDPSSRRHLGLFARDAGDRHSLFAVLKSSVTAMGHRQLAEDLSSPERDIATINARLDLIGWFADRPELCLDCQEKLKGLGDPVRGLGRLLYGYGGPRLLGMLRDALARSGQLHAGILAAGDRNLPALLQPLPGLIAALQPFAEQLQTVLTQELPADVKDGGYINDNYAPELTQLRAQLAATGHALTGLERRYLQQTAAASLKIKSNAQIGLHIEVKRKDAEKLGRDFLHRQTIANVARYHTPALTELEQQQSQARTRALEIEAEIFVRLLEETEQYQEPLQQIFTLLGRIDLAMGLAQLAVARSYCRPVVKANGAFLKIVDGRHPVIEQHLGSASGPDSFVANSCHLGGDCGHIQLLTGPNMAGKSTFLRQNALIALMAHAGLYVPASEAEMSLVDRIFCRIGADDDLAQHRSTFMVEMMETATILHQATDQSLIIIDEVGRGTATWDGIAIAWAVLEYLHDRFRVRTLFATHFQELTRIARRRSGIEPWMLVARTAGDQIMFDYTLARGVARQSHGINIARRAGLPHEVVARSQALLDTMTREIAPAGFDAVAEADPEQSARPQE